MRKLADFEEIEPMFRDVGISKEWLQALVHGETKTYNRDTILNYWVQDGICVINSGSIANARFCKSILKDIKDLITSHERVIISSSVDSIEGYLNKQGFRYNKQIKTYSKGV